MGYKASRELGRRQLNHEQLLRDCSWHTVESWYCQNCLACFSCHWPITQSHWRVLVLETGQLFHVALKVACFEILSCWLVAAVYAYARLEEICQHALTYLASLKALLVLKINDTHSTSSHILMQTHSTVCTQKVQCSTPCGSIRWALHRIEPAAKNNTVYVELDQPLVATEITPKNSITHPSLEPLIWYLFLVCLGWLSLEQELLHHLRSK